MRIPSLVVALAVALPAAVGAKPTAIERTAELILALKQVKAAKDGQTLSAADRDANKAAFKRLDGFFDFATLTTEPLSPHKAKLTAEQQSKIRPLFEELIRLVAYPRSGTFLRDAQYQVRPGQTPTQAEMDATLSAEDFKTTVVFHWAEKGGALRVVDVSFDGASLVKDYKNQFGRIIEKEGGDGLVKKLSNRLAKERQKQGA